MRVTRAGATGEILVRADAGFWSRKLIDTLERLKVAYSITVNVSPSILSVVAEIPDSARVRITNPDGGEAQVRRSPTPPGGAIMRLHPRPSA